ncbi:hypothetical protein NHQ30_009514 [Ciborinia camelliae]|nr:hypothetical protein NHQ30_009514 [Ciborinia camelliae]
MSDSFKPEPNRYQEIEYDNVLPLYRFISTNVFITSDAEHQRIHDFLNEYIVVYPQYLPDQNTRSMPEEKAEYVRNWVTRDGSHTMCLCEEGQSLMPSFQPPNEIGYDPPWVCDATQDILSTCHEKEIDVICCLADKFTLSRQPRVWSVMQSLIAQMYALHVKSGEKRTPRSLVAAENLKVPQAKEGMQIILDFLALRKDKCVIIMDDFSLLRNIIEPYKAGARKIWEFLFGLLQHPEAPVKLFIKSVETWAEVSQEGIKQFTYDVRWEEFEEDYGWKHYGISAQDQTKLGVRIRTTDTA